MTSISPVHPTTHLFVFHGICEGNLDGRTRNLSLGFDG